MKKPVLLSFTALLGTMGVITILGTTLVAIDAGNLGFRECSVLAGGFLSTLLGLAIETRKKQTVLHRNV